MASKILQRNNIFSFGVDENIADGDFDEFFNGGKIVQSFFGQFVFKPASFQSASLNKFPKKLR